MAKNVTVQGASYEDVPAVELPQTGGGTALFTDTSDSTLESANELVSGVTAYDRSGNLLTGTADYMDLVSNPTANDVLVTDANGQAQDSGVQLSTLTGKQDALTAGTGIALSGNTISNVFAQLPNATNLTTINYNYQGYVFNAPDRPTNAGNNGIILSFFRDNSTDYRGVQFYCDLNGTSTAGKIWTRYCGSTQTWSSWEEITGKQDTLTAGNGILISGNTISNKFPRLSSPNLDNITYNFQGYATSPTYTYPDTTTTTLASGYLCVFDGLNDLGNYTCQLFAPYNSNKISIRKKNGGTWTEWYELINASGGTMEGKLTLKGGLAFTGGLTAVATAPYFITLNQSYASGGAVGYVIKANMLKAIGGTYEAGDTISYDAQIVSAGYITSSTKELRFNIPVSKPINATGISFSKLTVAMYNDSGTKMSATQVAGTTGYTLTNSSVGVNHIYVRLGLPSAPSGVTNNTSCTIVVTALTAEFQ